MDNLKFILGIQIFVLERETTYMEFQVSGTEFEGEYFQAGQIQKNDAAMIWEFDTTTIWDF